MALIAEIGLRLSLVRGAKPEAPGHVQPSATGAKGGGVSGTFITVPGSQPPLALHWTRSPTAKRSPSESLTVHAMNSAVICRRDPRRRED